MSVRIGQEQPSTFAELAGALFWTGEEPVLILRGFRGYFDESGHTDDPNTNAFALGGCVGSAENWLAFDKAWSKALVGENVHDKYGVQWFHMKDFAHSRNAFEGWPEERRRKLLSELVKSMTDNSLYYVATAWHFDEGSSRYDLDYYYNAGYRTSMMYAESFSEGQELDLILADHEEISHAVYEDRHQRVRAAYASSRKFGSLTFGDPRRFTPLQAGDLIAYEVRANASNLNRLRWPLAQLPRERCRFELLSPA